MDPPAVPAKPRVTHNPRRSKRGHVDCELHERVALTTVLGALHVAMTAAKMATTPKRAPKVAKANVGPHRSSPGFLGRFRELVEAGETVEDATELLVALVQSKTEEHRDRRGFDEKAKRARTGHYLDSKSLTRDEWWSKNLGAARAHLAKDRDVKPDKPAAPGEVDGEPLTDDEAAVWVGNSSVSWSWADKAVRDHRLEQQDIEEQRRRAAST